MQKELDNQEYWENKEAKKVLSMSNQGAINNAVSITDIEQRMGLLNHIKTSDDLITHINGNRNRCKDWAYEGIDKFVFKATETPRQATEKENRYDATSLATDKQVRAVWAIIYSPSGDETLTSELPEGITKNTLKLLTFDQAHDFIEKYGKKKQE